MGKGQVGDFGASLIHLMNLFPCLLLPGLPLSRFHGQLCSSEQLMHWRTKIWTDWQRCGAWCPSGVPPRSQGYPVSSRLLYSTAHGKDTRCFLYSTVLYCTELYSTVLHHTVFCSIGFSFSVLHISPMHCAWLDAASLQVRAPSGRSSETTQQPRVSCARLACAMRRAGT